MAKSHKTRRARKNVMRSIRKTTERALPVVNKGLKNVGMITQGAVKKSIPVVTKGVAAVYNSMALGVNWCEKCSESWKKREPWQKR
jgi:Mg/Co/Ni transporter MgtE